MKRAEVGGGQAEAAAEAETIELADGGEGGVPQDEVGEQEEEAAVSEPVLLTSPHLTEGVAPSAEPSTEQELPVAESI